MIQPDAPANPAVNRIVPLFFLLLQLSNAGTNNARRVIEPIVMRTEKFLAILEECHATKSTNGKNPEVAIQASSKVLYMALSNYTLAYSATTRYTADDFED
jgi:hypothetical protein